MVEASKESFKVHTNRCHTCRDRTAKQSKLSVARKSKNVTKLTKCACECGKKFKTKDMSMSEC